MAGVPASIMGIINVTPDSFFDGGRYDTTRAAVDHGLDLVAQGASILDVGGESTRPGAAPVAPADEIRRVVPVIEALATRCVVSVDTRHDEVARAAVRAGATIVNDISGELYAVAADLGVGWMPMHMQGTPATMQAAPHYDDVTDEVFAYLCERGRIARSLGVEQVWLDPGFGFGKSVEHNVALLARLSELVEMQRFPVAVGLSRKSFLGALTGRDAPEDRLAASLAGAVLARRAGASLFRVHDVAATRDALVVADALSAPDDGQR